ncbi:hypothetical protein IEQ34_023111 [Dendrobium chrysotoxum]|uniref:Uncharacterized protein n=1 Tax=Dendrobium chrysotoxum TaxID=161865 RepID=A0AAV7FZ02_DENCH|nr:hypothetical protein IEQ34_023111 [Dendrobium chrysotoxum]
MEYSMSIPICFADDLKWDPVPYKFMAVLVLFFDVQGSFVDRLKFMKAYVVLVGVISSTFKGIEVLLLANLFHNAAVYAVLCWPLIRVYAEDS